MINILINSNDINEIKIENSNSFYNLIINKKLEKILLENKIDILVIDYEKPCIEFVLKIKIIKRLNPAIKIIVAIEMIEESLIRLLYDNGVDYILIRPLDLNNLRLVFKKIINYSSNINVLSKEFEKNNSIDKIINILNKLGMPANLKGYSYIKNALLLCLKDNEYYLHTTSKLYPKLAKIFKTKASCIEKAIRNAIELSWCRGDIKEQDKIFGYTIDRNKGRPTNGEFLAQLINYLSIS